MKTYTFVSIEGKDGQGKTTQATKLVNYLKDCGFRACYIKSPDSKSIFYSTIYKLLENGNAKENPILFQFVQFCNKLFFQLFRLPKVKSAMDVIVMDRWDVSMQAYGHATGVPSSIIRFMSVMLEKPHQVFLLSDNPTLRLTPRDAYEKDSELQKRVEDFYNSCEWRSDYEMITEITVSENVEDTFNNIVSQLSFRWQGEK